MSQRVSIVCASRPMSSTTSVTPTALLRRWPGGFGARLGRVDLNWPRNSFFTSPACGGGRRATAGGGGKSIPSTSASYGSTPTPALPRKRERERAHLALLQLDPSHRAL